MSNLVKKGCNYLYFTLNYLKKTWCCFFWVCVTLPTFAQDTDFALAKQFEQNGEIEKALSIYTKIYQSPKSTMAYEGCLNCLITLKKYSEAKKLTKKMGKLYPNNLNYRLDQGRIYIAEGKEQDAFDVYEDIIQDLPKNGDKIIELSQLFVERDQVDFAIKSLQYGRKLLRNSDIFIKELIELYAKKKDVGALSNDVIAFFIHHPEELTFVKKQIEYTCKELNDYDIVKSFIFKALQRSPENIELTELLIWTMMQKREFSLALIQITALDKRLNENGQRIYQYASIFLSNKAYDVAIRAYAYLIAKGTKNTFYIPASAGILEARSQKIEHNLGTKEDFIALEEDYLKLLQEFGKGAHTLSAMRHLAHLQAYRLNKLDNAETLMEEILQIPNLNQQTIDEIKLELGDLYIINEEPWEATLIYGQVEKSERDSPLGQEAMFRNAKLAFYSGDFSWAKSQLDILKGGTSQLIANDAMDLSTLLSENMAQDSTQIRALKLYAQAELNTFKTRYSQAFAYLDSLSQEYPAHALEDDNLMCRTKIYMAQQQWQNASKTLESIVQGYYSDTLADDALFILAELQETQLNDKESAKNNYQRLLSDFPSSVHIVEARKRFRHLRGDIIKEDDN